MENYNTKISNFIAAKIDDLKVKYRYIFFHKYDYFMKIDNNDVNVMIIQIAVYYEQIDTQNTHEKIKFLQVEIIKIQVGNKIHIYTYQF